MVSGRYFRPNAPLLCVKWMPACAVTSLNAAAGAMAGAMTAEAVTAIAAHASVSSARPVVRRCSWMDWRSLLSSGDFNRYGPVIACADSSALKRA